MITRDPTSDHVTSTFEKWRESSLGHEELGAKHWRVLATSMLISNMRGNSAYGIIITGWEVHDHTLSDLRHTATTT